MATKVSAAIDDDGVPFSLMCVPANTSDMRLLQPALDAAMVPTPNDTPLYADKGYDSNANRRTCISYGLRDRIFKRKTTNGRRTHAKRGVVERFFSWVDKFRRLLLRYESYVSVYESMSYLAFGIILQSKL